ncbi:hypothetical protein VTN77DRAFT_6604 [Rasamsonia byssochlamydoides]|uniref:uncharacterized protein n=1 Tax=Rasamsonia byssochlamydoides TaxID=89139 RepID=UPI003742B3D0
MLLKSKRRHSEDHPDWLASRHELAQAYQASGHMSSSAPQSNILQSEKRSHVSFRKSVRKLLSKLQL